MCGAYRVSAAKAEVEVHCATSHGRLGKQEVKEVVEDAVNQRISFAFLCLSLFSSPCLSLSLAFSFRVAQVLSRLLSHFSLHSENFSTDFVCLFLFFSIAPRQLRKINVNEELEK